MRKLWLASALVLACQGEAERSPVPAGTRPVEIVHFSPQGWVEAPRPLEVQFSEPVVPQERVGTPISGELLVITPPIAGRAVWRSRQKLEWWPAEGFAESTRYHVQLRPSGLGPAWHLLGERQFDFHTSLITLRSTEAIVSPEGVRVLFEFSHPVHPEEVLAAAVFRDAEGRVLPAQLAQGDVLETPRLVEALLPTLAGVAQPRLHLRLDGRLRAAAGGETLGKVVERVLEPSAGGALIVEGAALKQLGVRLALEVRLSGSIDVDELAGKLELQPSVDYRAVAVHRGFRLEGDFRPGVRYEIRIKPGLVGTRGERFEGWSRAVEVPLIGPALAVDGPWGLVLGEKRALDLEAVGVRRLLTEVWAVYDENLVHALDAVEAGEGPAWVTLAQSVGSTELTVRTSTVRATSVQVPFEPAAGRPASYFVAISDAERSWVRAEQWVLAVDLGLQIKLAPRWARAEVRALASGRPVADAEVRFISRSNETVARGRTTVDGLLEVALADRPVVAVARQGASYAVLPLGDRELAVAASDSKVDRVGRGRAFVYVAAPRVRPGQILSALVVPRDPGGVALAGGLVAELAGVRLPVVNDGLLRFSIPSNTPHGPTSLIVRDLDGLPVGEAPVLIEGGGPQPTFEIVAESGEAPNFKITGQRGAAPLAGQELEVFCVVAPARPAQFEDFVFGSGGVETPKARLRLDESGQARTSCPVPNEAGPWRLTLRLEADGQRHEASKVLGNTPLIGLASPGWLEVKRDAGLKLILTDPSGAPRPGAAVKVRIEALDWRRDGRGWHQKARVLEDKVITSADGPMSVPFVPPHGGVFRVTASADGSATEKVVYAAGPLAPGAQPVRPGELLMVPMSPQVAAGGTLDFLVIAPFAGRLQLSLERDRVVTERVEVMSQPISVLRIPVASSWAPEVVATATLEEPAAGRRSRRAFGAVRLRLDPRPRSLEVRIFAEAPDANGRGQVRIKVEGAATRPQVYLAAVEAGASADLRQIDPWRVFGGAAAHTVDTLDLAAAFAPAAPSAPWSPTVSLPGISSRATFFESIPVGADGWAVINFDYRSFSGPVEFTAFSVAQDRHGAARAKAGAGLALRVELPPILRVGDRIDARLALEGEGAVRAKVAAQSTAVDVDAQPEKPGVWRLSLRAKASGPLLLEAEVPGTSKLSQSLVLKVDPAEAQTWQMEQATLSPGQSWTPERAPHAVAVTGLAAEYPPAWLGASPLSPHTADGLAQARLNLLQEPATFSEAVEFLVGRQQPTGWPAWPEGPVDADTTLDAAQFLIDARRLGRPVPSALMTPTVEQTRVLATQGSLVQRARAAYLASLVGRASFSVVVALADEVIAGPPVAQAEVAAAQAFLGRKSKGVALLDALPDTLLPAPQGSAVVHTARALAAVVDVLPGHPRVAQWAQALRAASKNGHWGHRVEDAWALYALSKLPRGPETWWGRVTQDGQPVDRFSSNVFLVTPLDRELVFSAVGQGSISVARAWPVPAPPGAQDLTVTQSWNSDKLVWPLGAELGGKLQIGGNEPVWVHWPHPPGAVFERAQASANGAAMVIAAHPQPEAAAVWLALPAGAERSVEVFWRTVFSGEVTVPGVWVQRLDGGGWARTASTKLQIQRR